jgi:uncharacterized protein YegJ (DUF2314 family)
MNQNDVLQALRQNVESKEYMADGSVWGHVYLPNIPFSGKQLSGVLSNLAQQKLYETVYGRYFGKVRIS